MVYGAAGQKCLFTSYTYNEKGKHRKRWGHLYALYALSAGTLYARDDSPFGHVITT